MRTQNTCLSLIMNNKFSSVLVNGQLRKAGEYRKPNSLGSSEQTINAILTLWTQCGERQRMCTCEKGVRCREGLLFVRFLKGREIYVDVSLLRIQKPFNIIFTVKILCNYFIFFNKIKQLSQYYDIFIVIKLITLTLKSLTIITIRRYLFVKRSRKNYSTDLYEICKNQADILSQDYQSFV